MTFLNSSYSSMLSLSTPALQPGGISISAFDSYYQAEADGPVMESRAPRVGHKKSRKGCAQCKRRHVKVRPASHCICERTRDTGGTGAVRCGRSTVYEVQCR